MTIPKRKKRVSHLCTRCRKRFAHSFTTFCDNCGGMIDVEYDLEHVIVHDSDNPLERFFDLLPLEDPAILLVQEMRYQAENSRLKLQQFHCVAEKNAVFTFLTNR